jgi:hypothetical protein
MIRFFIRAELYPAWGVLHPVRDDGVYSTWYIISSSSNEYHGYGRSSSTPSSHNIWVLVSSYRGNPVLCNMTVHTMHWVSFLVKLSGQALRASFTARTCTLPAAVGIISILGVGRPATGDVCSTIYGITVGTYIRTYEATKTRRFARSRTVFLLLLTNSNLLFPKQSQRRTI